MGKEKLSVANVIKALALINIQDIFKFMITATDDEIIDRYGSEETAINIAEKYLQIATKAEFLELPLQGWSMKYSMPIKDSDERAEHEATFYDVKDETSVTKKDE